jgi:MscS family membrane protein
MVANRFCLFFLSFFCVHILAAKEQSYLDLNLSTPRAAIITHLGSLQPDNYQVKIAAKVFSQKGRTEEEAISLAIKLRDILEEKAVHIDLQTIPDDTNYIDPKYKFHRYQLTPALPKVYLVKVYGRWIYSEATVRFIDAFQQRHNFLDKEGVIKKLPNFFLQKTILKLYVWQILAIIFSIGFLILIYRFIAHVCKQLLKLLALRVDYEEIIRLAEPLSLILLTLLFRLMVWYLSLPLPVHKTLVEYTKSLLCVFTISLFYKLVDVGGSYIYRKTVEKTWNFNLVLLPMLRVSLKVVVLLLGGLATLQTLHFDIKGLLTGVGIGGLGFALASQDTIKNLFGSLVILIDKPFDVGDMILSGDIEGRVEEIGFRSTRIYTKQSSTIYVPNGKLADAYIDNYGTKQYRGFSTLLVISYNTPLAVIETFIEGLRKLAEHHPATREGRQTVYVHSLKESRLEIQFDVKFNLTDGNKEKEVKHELLLGIIKLAETLHLPFAFPTQTIHMESFPEKQPNKPPYLTDPEALKERLQEFFAKPNLTE